MWLILCFSNVVYSEYHASLEWVSTPLVGPLLGITLVSLLFHGHLGIVVIIDDYVREPWRKRAINISAVLTAIVGLTAIVAIVALAIAQ